MANRYSSKEQERLYQPQRLAVVHCQGPYYDKVYRLFRVDMSQDHSNPGFIVATWRWTKRPWRSRFLGDGHWVDGYPADKHATGLSAKQDVMNMGKHQAVELLLPFHLQKDYWESEPDFRGMKKPLCVICGEPTYKYTKGEDACDRCKAFAERGRMIDAERSLTPVHVDGLLPRAANIPNRHGLCRAIAHTLYRLVADNAREQVVESDRRRKEDPRELREELRHPEGGGGHQTPVSMTEDQDLAARDLIAAIGEAVLSAYREGTNHGSNILELLAAGELPPDAFERQRFKP